MRLMLTTKTYSYKTLEEAESHVDKMIADGWRPFKRGIGKHQCIMRRLDETFPYDVEYRK